MDKRKLIENETKWKGNMYIKSIERKLTKKIKIIIGVLAFLLTTNAHSIIIDLDERDYLVAGDGLITYDKSTGLEWLDLTFTAGYSMLETEANASIWADGWQWTTVEQMETMFDHESDTYPYEEPETVKVYPIVELLGPTSTWISPGEYIVKKVMGYSRNFLFDTTWYEDGGYDYSTAIIEAGINLDTSDPWYPYLSFPLCDPEDCADWRNPGWKETDSGQNYGAWLVRDTASVPEPSILLLLLCSGFLGIFVFARRKA